MHSSSASDSKVLSLELFSSIKGNSPKLAKILAVISDGNRGTIVNGLNLSVKRLYALGSSQS